MSSFAIYAEDAEKISRLMAAYLKGVNAEYLLLCHKDDGSVVAEAGSIGTDATPLAVLGVASFGSASQIGMMLGGEGFTSVSYNGKSRSIFISSVDASLVLFQVFPGKLPSRIEDYNRLIVDKLLGAVPSFTQGTSSSLR